MLTSVLLLELNNCLILFLQIIIQAEPQKNPNYTKSDEKKDDAVSFMSNYICVI